ncbi:hypothetical protein [Dietzia sp. CH92]|uniref:hypothetical protein n=1 Tax=Dietzia sp. CH92 TaxID=3051823 RepID=UPI0028D55111|nr:hypothetical protein [Dietzia sp. CH92]
MSFAVLALAVAGAGVAGLALTALATAFLPVPPAGRAVAALLGLVATVAAMGWTSRRLTDRAIRAEYGEEPGGQAERPGGDGLG